MTRFISTSRGYANLNDIELVKLRRRNKYQFVVGGSIIDKNVPQFGNELTKIIPVNGDWECLTEIGDARHERHLRVEPVVAWGFTVLGAVVPVTPGSMKGVEGKFALRQRGQAEIYSADQTYASQEDWLNPDARRPPQF